MYSIQLDSKLSGPVSSPGQGHCVAFFGQIKTGDVLTILLTILLTIIALVRHFILIRYSHFLIIACCSKLVACWNK